MNLPTLTSIPALPKATTQSNEVISRESVSPINSMMEIAALMGFSAIDAIPRFGDRHIRFPKPNKFSIEPGYKLRKPKLSGKFRNQRCGTCGMKMKRCECGGGK